MRWSVGYPWERLVSVCLCCLVLGCSTYTLKQSGVLVSKDKREAMLAHMSVAVVLSDESLNEAQRQDVMQRAYVASGKVAQFSKEIVSRFQVLMRERFGLYVRYNRKVSLRLVPMDTDEALMELDTDGLERDGNSWFRWYYLLVYPIIPVMWLIHLFQGDQDGWTVWRHYDAQSKAFHGGSAFDGQPYAETARVLHGADALFGESDVGKEEGYPVYVSLGVGAVCHLTDGCNASVRIVAIDHKGGVLLTGKADGKSADSADPKAGMLTGAVMNAFDNLLSSPEVVW